MKKTLGVLIVVAVLAATWWYTAGRDGPEPPAASNDSERRLAGGLVVGFEAEAGTHAWLGVPYAKPPVGDLRWRAPEPPDAWSGTLEALAPGSVCPQVGGPLGGVERREFSKIVGDEDCLYLNVWAPRFAPGEVPAGDRRLPVMVWIHGGGNTIGHGADYDGSRLAGGRGLVVVTLNYRLGVLGWFRHPALRAGVGTPRDVSGNFGTLDLVRALKWVRRNIAAFGGDPDRVTVFGESAGGLNIYSLLTAPPAAGLFHGAIVQSGMARSMAPAVGESLEADGGHAASSAELAARWLVAAGRAPDLEAARALQQRTAASELGDFLRGLSPRELLAGFGDAPGGMYEVPFLFEDGTVLPDRPVNEVFAAGGHHPVPLIAGTNRDEVRLFMLLNPSYVERKLWLLLRLRDPAAYRAVSGLLTANWQLGGVDRPLAAIAANQQAPVFAYRFDWDETGRNLLADMPELLGSAHGFELPFVFGDFSGLWGIPMMFPEDGAASRRALSDAMMGYWAEFAYRGDPGRGRDGRQPRWERWPAGGPGRRMVFDTEAGGGLRMETGAIAPDDLRSRLRDLPPGNDPLRPCALYALMFWHTGDFDHAEYRGLSPACEAQDPRALATIRMSTRNQPAD